MPVHIHSSCAYVYTDMDNWTWTRTHTCNHYTYTCTHIRTLTHAHTHILTIPPLHLLPSFPAVVLAKNMRDACTIIHQMCNGDDTDDAGAAELGAALSTAVGVVADARARAVQSGANRFPAWTAAASSALSGAVRAAALLLAPEGPSLFVQRCGAVVHAALDCGGRGPRICHGVDALKLLATQAVATNHDDQAVHVGASPQHEGQDHRLPDES